MRQVIILLHEYNCNEKLQVNISGKITICPNRIQLAGNGEKRALYRADF